MIKEMLQSVRNYLSNFGNADERIIEAMQKFDRKYFIPKSMKVFAYEDGPLYIGYGQTISQPSTVARMISLLELKAGDNVLEIGTGSGWNASLISYLIGSKGKVLSLEIDENLIRNAKKAIENFKIKNIEIKREDFRKIDEKFDKIIFTAGILEDEEKIIDGFAYKSLNEKGILICPYRRGQLIMDKKLNDKIEKSYTREEYVFVPLILR